MKPDCLLCTASSLILSTGALYNSLMLIVTNKSSLPPPPPPPTRSAISHPVPGPPWTAAREQRRSSVMKKRSGGHTHTHVNYLFNKYAITITPGAITAQCCMSPQGSGIQWCIPWNFCSSYSLTLTGWSHFYRLFFYIVLWASLILIIPK